MANTLPEFERPPLDELVISVQFEPLPGFRAVHIGRFWTRIRDRYPFTEDQAPLAQMIEPPDVTPVTQVLAIHQLSVPTRCWFLEESKNRLIQLQQGRFVRNWRKLNEADEYPRYQVLVEEFKREWEAFLAFVKDESLGQVTVNQCELTYIDHIEPPAPDRLGDVGGIFSFLRPPNPSAFLPTPEVFSWSAGYKLPDGRGRLHVEMNPAFRPRDMRMILAVTFTARGAPAGTTDQSVFDWFNLAHEWINRAFDELTDPKMHQAWGKKMKCDLLEMGSAVTNRLNQPQVAQEYSASGLAVTSAPVLVIHGPLGWVFEAAKKLEALGRLRRGWDSYDGLPVRPEAREMTVRVLDKLQGRSLPVPGVVLGSDGTVHLEWRANGRELEVGLGDSATIDYVKVGPEGNIEELTEDARNQQLLLHLTRWLMYG